MEKKKYINNKAQIIKDECVACGTCLKACPLHLITIVKGIYADINWDKCVGCGRCAKVCPASVIVIKPATMEVRENEN